MKKLVFTFIAVMCCMAMNAQTTFEVGGIKYSVTGTGGYTVEVVAKDSKYTGSVIIPATVTNPDDDETYNVTGIGDQAFFNCFTMSSVTIPEGVTSIGEMAFMGSTGLTSITIPEGVTSIGAQAFDNTGWCNKHGEGSLLYLCKYLVGVKGVNTTKDIVIEGGTMTIADGALRNCNSLVSITIPNSVTSIGDWAFHVETMESITVDSENHVYDSRYDCNAIIEKETKTLIAGCKNTIIPSDVTSIGNDAFRVCDKLTSVTIPSGVTHIGENAFFKCSGLTEIYVLATTPPELGNDAFWDVPKGIPVYVPDVEKYTGWGKFTNLIKNVELPTAKEEAKADLQTFINEEKIANAPMKEYADRINDATALKYITSTVNDIKAEINNSDKFTLGEWKYLLGKNDEKYTIVGGSLTFTDKELYQCDYNFTANNLTYSRTFNNTNWQPLYVPFAISYDEWNGNFDVAAINNFHEYTNDKGQTIRTELEVRLVKSGKLKPNHPYLIKALDAAKPLQIELTTKEISKSDNKSYSCSSMESQYTFTGTYQEMNGLKTNDYIFMSGGKLCKAEDDEVVLLPQRWYLKIKSLGSQVDGGNTSDVKAMEFDIKLLDDDVTGIDEITVTRTPLKNSVEAIYNLNGMRVNDSYKGIVIKNGKKILQK